ncbi:MAG: hypothetical protein C0501_14705 [Isosphaera sp.]|nr:hypothetical protein [Isosphaera sp.]
MGNLIWILIAVVVISTVVGAVAKLLNNLAEMNAAANPPAGARPRPPGPARPGNGNGGGGRQASSDMDRFLAEIDRLRKKSADAPPPNQAPAAPAAQPEKRPDRPRPRVTAEPADPPKADHGFAAPPGPRPADLPVASVVTPAGGTGAPAATRVTRFVDRPRPVAKTPFAKSLTALLASGHGLATAVVLQEVLGPPRSRRKG